MKRLKLDFKHDRQTAAASAVPAEPHPTTPTTRPINKVANVTPLKQESPQRIGHPSTPGSHRGGGRILDNLRADRH
jgi:hypothetical protein